MLLPGVKYAKIMMFGQFRRSEWRPEGPPKHQNPQLFAGKVRKFEFRDGGQAAPSQAATRAGGTGDVLTGLLPSHSNEQCAFCDAASLGEGTVFGPFFGQVLGRYNP